MFTNLSPAITDPVDVAVLVDGEFSLACGVVDAVGTANFQWQTEISSGSYTNVNDETSNT